MIGRLDPAARLVVDRHQAAPAAVAVAARGNQRGTGVFGRLSHGPEAAPVELTTPFDLASVTKPFVALTFARLVRRGLVRMDERLADVLPELRDTFAGAQPLELVLAHRAGLMAHHQLYAPLIEGRPIDRRAALEAACAARPECAGPAPADGFPPLYSDMGYLLLGLSIEARAGLPLDEAVAQEVTRPLGIDRRVGSARQQRASQARFDERVAPTEVVAFRGGVVRGVVHDENAWALSGDGLSGHAGLFGDAEAVLTLGLAVRDALTADAGWLGPRDLEPLVRVRPGGTLRAGFDGRAHDKPSSGARLGAQTFGHLGFTGTSLWIDRESAFVGVLLTNRVHPTREHIAIRAARPDAYDAMFDALVSAPPTPSAR